MIKKILFIVVSLAYLSSTTVMAITPEDQQSLNMDTEYYLPSQCIPGASATGTTLTGSDNEQEAYNFFIQNGLSPVQAAAVVGNLIVESDVDPTVMQIGGDSQNPDDAGSEGWGIAQWTPGSKVIGIAQSLNITTPIYDLATQLNIVWGEMSGTSPTGNQDMLSQLKQITDINQATLYFEEDFEEGLIAQTGPPSDDGDLAGRQQAAASVLALYGSPAGNSGSAVTTTTNETTSSGCTSSTGGAVNCSAGTSSNLSPTRQEVVCIAEQELNTWEAQAGYATADFPYAATGYLTYSQGWYEEWCADFVSWIYNQAGDPLQPDPNWRIASIDSIEGVGQEGQNFQWHPQSSGYVPQPGDLAIHSGPNINHVNMFISSSGGVSTYIGGDAGDYSPYGVASPTQTAPSPPSESIVADEYSNGYYGDSIIGYVSPD